MLRRFVCAVAASLVLALPAAAIDVSYLGSFTWSETDRNFGGFSGLELSEDGLSFHAISDRGRIVVGQLSRNAEGRVVGVEAGDFLTLKGTPKRGMPRHWEDSEGLAIGRNGRIFISFEGAHRVWSYGAPDAQARALPVHADFEDFQNNSGMEGLAIDDKDRLYALPERSGEKSRPFPVYRYGLNQWEVAFALPRRGEYLPVGLDFDTEGRLYLLERWFRGIGFSSRVRRFTLAGSEIAEEVVLIETALAEHDNLEGIAVWHDSRGTRITMISDDNFKPFQLTEFVDYRIVD